jgi:flagellar biosynthesis protein FliQ
MTLTVMPKMIAIFVAASLTTSFGEMVLSPDMMKRRLRETAEFFRFLRERRRTAR